jgi:nucleoside-diphosphate-sugar epimerase
MRVLVMGGTRMMGLRTLDELVRRGHEVAVFNRGRTPASLPPGVRVIRGDRDVAADHEQLRDERPDGVVDFSAFTGKHAAFLLDAIPEVPRLVHCSSGAVYRPDPVLPWSEATTAMGPWSTWGKYAVGKLDAETVLRQGRADTSLATTVLRPPYVLAPGNYAVREEWVLNRLLDDAEVLVPGDGQSVSHFVSAQQVAVCAVNVLEAFADGGFRAFNVAEPAAMASACGFVELCGLVSGRSPRVRSVAAPSGSFAREDSIFPFPNENYLLDTREAHRAGIQPPGESLLDMLHAAFDHLVAHPERRRWTRSPAELQALEQPVQ